MASHKRKQSIAISALDHINITNKLEWLASLDTAYSPEHNYRRSAIICTIGPKTNSVEAINKLRSAGLNVVRMNFSHGSYGTGLPTPWYSETYL
jgi:pyruvate kinase